MSEFVKKAACKLSGTARGEDRLLGHHIGASEADTAGPERHETMKKAAIWRLFKFDHIC